MPKSNGNATHVPSKQPQQNLGHSSQLHNSGNNYKGQAKKHLVADKDGCAVNRQDARQKVHSSTAYSYAQPAFRYEPTFFSSSKQLQTEPIANHLAKSYLRENHSVAIAPVGLPWQRSLSPSLRAELLKLRYIFSLFLATRAVLVLIGLVSYATLPKGFGKQDVWSNQPWLDIWGVWDSMWYMDIAQNGYSTATKLVDFPDQTNFAFFPLYPLLMRFVGIMTGGDPFIAGLIISNVCLISACYLLYKLVELEWGDVIARRSIKYLLLFPVSFILSGVFTESLYLCLSLLCFYLAKKRRWWLAGLCGGLLSATRSLGVLIAVPLLWEYASSIRFKPSQIRLSVLFVALVPLGLLAFSYYNYQATGDFLFFKTNQAAWNRDVMNPLFAFWQALSQGFGEPSFKKILECSFFVGAFGLLSAFYKTIGMSYWLLGMYSILVPLSVGVASMPRFTLPIFPLFIALAALSRKSQWNRWLAIGLGALQGGLMMLWCTGHGLVI
ncbi:MAG: hypothetical protein AAF703_13125 [Cyanobacteria bacterium P01_D01_bin.105]